MPVSCKLAVDSLPDTIFVNTRFNSEAMAGVAPYCLRRLNRVFTNIVSGTLSTANLQLTGIESGHPVIYDLSNQGAQLRFSIGGFVASTMQVKMSTDLTNWQTVQTYTASTNLPVFTIQATQAVASFFQVR